MNPLRKISKAAAGRFLKLPKYGMNSAVAEATFEKALC